jgi:hypothetical protein
MTSLPSKIKSHEKEFAEGILYYGGAMYNTAAQFKAWLCWGVVNNPRTEDSELDTIKALWSSAAVKEAFDKLNIHPQVKSVQNWMAPFKKNALPLIQKRGFEEGISEAITNHGAELLRFPAPKKQEKCEGICDKCGKKCGKI